MYRYTVETYLNQESYYKNNSIDLKFNLKITLYFFTSCTNRPGSRSAFGTRTESTFVCKS
jgi:hypothetical protein